MTIKAQIKERTIYPIWNIEVPQTPPRSRLFKLEPIGIGTDVVESLTSYTARLAAEHCTSPYKLLSNEVLALMERDTFPSLKSRGCLAKRLNGLQTLTDLVIASFERLTLRDDLRHMTLFNWRNILSHSSLLRGNRAWCAFCYEECLSDSKVIYDPLVWAIKIITVCLKHNERLCEICPKCMRQLSFLDSYYVPGYCSQCHAWLGAANKAYLNLKSFKGVEQTELCRQAQLALPVSELLSCSPKIKSIPTPESFIANLADAIAKKASHNINFFADLVGVWSGSIRRLLMWETKLRLEVLCQLCSRLNATPLELLLDGGNSIAFRDRHLLFERDIPVVKEASPWEEVEGMLRLALKESPPPSMEAVARQMGYHPRKVKNHYPELCQQLIDRYREHQRNKRPPQKKIISALKAALQEEPPPSLQRVFRRLGCKDTGYYYYVNYEDLCFAVAKRYKAYRNKPFNKGKDHKRLKAALNEEPPPSFSEVARRLDHKRDFVRRKFPELSKMIASRYLHYTKVLRKEKAERLRREIRKAIPQLSASGLNASEARVRALIKQTLPNLGRDSLFKQALREVKVEFGLA
jgi:hypothetical protein